MPRLNEDQKKERAKIVAFAIERVGIAKVKEWLKKPEYLRIINALAASKTKGGEITC